VCECVWFGSLFRDRSVFGTNQEDWRSGRKGSIRRSIVPGADVRQVGPCVMLSAVSGRVTSGKIVPITDR